MKILDEGKAGIKWVNYEAICQNSKCGARVVVEEGGIKAVDYSSGNTFWAVCIVCECFINIPEDKVPFKLQRVLNKKRNGVMTIDNLYKE